MKAFWIFLINVVFLTKISTASYMSKCAVIAAGSIAVSVADLNMYVQDDGEDVDSFIKSQHPTKEAPKEDEVTRLTRFHKECINETKVSPKMVNRLSKGKWNVGRNLNVTKLKLWAFCVLNRMGLMSKEGVYRLDVAYSRIPDVLKNAAENIIDKCLVDKNIPPFELAWRYLTCLNHFDSNEQFSKLGIFYNISSDIK